MYRRRNNLEKQQTMVIKRAVSNFLEDKKSMNELQAQDVSPFKSGILR